MSDRQYNSTVARLRRPERLALLEVDRVVRCCLENAPGPRVLDLGAGDGIFAEAFSEAGQLVSCLDIRMDMALAAKDHLPDIPFVLGDMNQLPLKANVFDWVFMSHVLHETDSPGQLLARLKNVATAVMALEWPYAEEDKGPPLDHRMKPEVAKEAGLKAGFTGFNMIQHSHMILYCYS